MSELKGRNALVTGGGTGVGFGIVKVLAAHGARVTLAARREQVLEDAIARLKAEGVPGKLESCVCDVTDEDQVKVAVEQASAGANLDVLVNNAGSGFPGTLLQIDAGAWRFCNDLNIVGPALCIKHAALVMKEHGGGSIINISSFSSGHVQPWLATYNVTKAGQDMLTRCAAIELAQHGIRVNSVAPGYVPSEGTEYFSEEMREGHVDITPMRRAGEPEEIGEAVLFFASERSKWVTGQCLGVDGGLSVPVGLDMAGVARGLYEEEAMSQFAVRDYRNVKKQG